MTLAEAKLVRCGDIVVEEREAKFRKHHCYRVSAEPWVSRDGMFVRFYLASMSGAWVSFEAFTLENPRLFISRGRVRGRVAV